MKYSSDLTLGEGLCIFTSFHFQDFGRYLLNGFDFFIYFEWRDTENQQYYSQTSRKRPPILQRLGGRFREVVAYESRTARAKCLSQPRMNGIFITP